MSQRLIFVLDIECAGAVDTWRVVMDSPVLDGIILFDPPNYFELLGVDRAGGPRWTEADPKQFTGAIIKAIIRHLIDGGKPKPGVPAMIGRIARNPIDRYFYFYPPTGSQP